jgi:hypothetical protein
MTEKNEAIQLEELTNQTQFSSEEPLYEKVASPLADTPAEQEHQAKLEKQRKRVMFMVISASVVLFFIVGALVLLVPKRMPIQRQARTTPSPKTQAQKTDLDLKLDQVELNLKNSDPSKIDLPFPPVDMGITLEKTLR